MAGTTRDPPIPALLTVGGGVSVSVVSITTVTVRPSTSGSVPFNRNFGTSQEDPHGALSSVATGDPASVNSVSNPY